MQIGFCFERDFMLSLSDYNQANIDNSYFEQMVSQIYPTELQLNKADSLDSWTCP